MVRRPNAQPICAKLLLGSEPNSTGHSPGASTSVHGHIDDTMTQQFTSYLHQRITELQHQHDASGTSAARRQELLASIERLQSETVRTHARRADESLSQEDWPALIAAATWFVENVPEVASFALTVRGDCHRDQGEFQRAIADYGQAIALNPQDAAAFNSRANAYLKLGEVEQAIADYEQAIALDPRSVGPHYDMACARSLREELEAAFLSLEMAARSPDFPHDEAASDPDLANLRDDPRFWDIVKRPPPD